MLRFLLLAFIATNAVGQTIYQCRATNGRVTLQDQPCPESATTELSRKTIGQQNAEYRAQPIVIGDQRSAERLASGIICPSLRQQYQSNLAWSERAMLRKDPTEIQRAAEAVRSTGAQVSKHRCE
ncbi:DUF4124 domain-containing protein [Cupriavidus lacunae]|uniref:DUF4124 domain-containing protein n=1 Tax=Cupriavidus lacunae TaxID=2666307 RepID=A0A370NSB5_9BURK|nr:DUF4124 domain-containing protein [Cupriavidus lacunae]RDK08499.1 hypothetical protein DN412_19990 [Cupriavidus lacunae]